MCPDTKDNYCSFRYRATIYSKEMAVSCETMLCNVNKQAQGQTLDFVGIYLPDLVFTHGQLYVVFSRVWNSNAVAVYINIKEGYTKNIVYKEVL